MANVNDSLKIFINGLVDIAHGINRDADLNCRVDEWGAEPHSDIDLNYAFGSPALIPDIPTASEWNITFVNVLSRTTDMERLVDDIIRTESDTKFARMVMYEYNATVANALSNLIREQQEKGNTTFIVSSTFNDFYEKWKYGPLSADVRNHIGNYREIMKIQEMMEISLGAYFPDQLSDEVMSITEDGFEFGFRISRKDDDITVSAVWAHEQDAVTSKEDILTVPLETVTDMESFQDLFNKAFCGKFPYDSFGELQCRQAIACAPNC